MDQTTPPSREPKPYVPWETFGHPYQTVADFKQASHARWASSADQSRAEVAEARTFKLKNSDGDVYLFTPNPFDCKIVWVRNKGEKKEFTTIGARNLWKDLIRNGYSEPLDSP